MVLFAIIKTLLDVVPGSVPCGAAVGDAGGLSSAGGSCKHRTASASPTTRIQWPQTPNHVQPSKITRDHQQIYFLKAGQRKPVSRDKVREKRIIWYVWAVGYKHVLMFNTVSVRRAAWQTRRRKDSQLFFLTASQVLYELRCAGLLGEMETCARNCLHFLHTILSNTKRSLKTSKLFYL